MGILRSSVTTALASGDTITITAPISGGGVARVSRAFYFTGLVATLPLDASGANTGVKHGPDRFDECGDDAGRRARCCGDREYRHHTSGADGGIGV